MLEAYTPEQLRFGSGVPPVAALTMDLDTLEDELPVMVLDDASNGLMSSFCLRRAIRAMESNLFFTSVELSFEHFPFTAVPIYLFLLGYAFLYGE
jgi:hypothetical protein